MIKKFVLNWTVKKKFRIKIEQWIQAKGKITWKLIKFNKKPKNINSLSIKIIIRLVKSGTKFCKLLS